MLVMSGIPVDSAQKHGLFLPQLQLRSLQTEFHAGYVFAPHDELHLGKATLRNHMNGTVGFEQLAIDMDMNAKCLMHMFSPSGNPTVSNLFTVLTWLQHCRDITFQVKVVQQAS